MEYREGLGFGLRFYKYAKNSYAGQKCIIKLKKVWKLNLVVDLNVIIFLTDRHNEFSIYK